MSIVHLVYSKRLTSHGSNCSIHVGVLPQTYLINYKVYVFCLDDKFPRDVTYENISVLIKTFAFNIGRLSRQNM